MRGPGEELQERAHARGGHGLLTGSADLVKFSGLSKRLADLVNV